MTSPTDDRLRTLLHELADDMPSMPLLERLESAPVPLLERRRTIFAMAAVAAAVALLLAGVLVVRDTRDPKFIDPVISPPRVFHLGTEMTSRPGTVHVAVHMARVQDAQHRNAQVLPAAGGPARVLATSATVPAAWYQSLSWDGTRLVRQNDSAGVPRLEVVNLRTGATNPLGGRYGYCPHLSPDNQTVAAFSTTTDGLELVDVTSGRVVANPEPTRLSSDACTAVGWSPTGGLLVVGGPDGSVVLDSDGRVVDRLPHSAVNGNMSWSPDGRSLLTYDRETRGFAIRDVRSGETSVLPAPGPDALRPLGWAGDRVVWLVGPVGDQRLVSTDTRGGDRRPWMRLALEGRPIDTVQWSWALSGRPLPSTD